MPSLSENSFRENAINAITLLQSYNSVAIEQKNQVTFIIELLTSTAGNPGTWENLCPFTMDQYGIAIIRSTYALSKEITENNLLTSFESLFNLATERSLVSQLPFNSDLTNSYHYFIQNIATLSDPIKNIVSHSAYSLPLKIIRYIFSSTDFELAKNMSKNKQHLEGVIHESERSLAEREKRVITLKEKLDKYENAFNFVALYNGFSDLRKQKNTSLQNTLGFLIIIGSIIVSALCYQGINSPLFNIDYLPKMLAFGFLDLTLLYFFRVLLSDYKRLQAELLQIDLRMTLCQFIQSYSFHAKEIKDNNLPTLEKFESIIFSDLTPGGNNIPTAFDGLTDFANFFNKSISPKVKSIN